MEEEWTEKKNRNQMRKDTNSPKKDERKRKNTKRTAAVREKKLIKKGVYNIGTRLTVRVGRQTTGTSTAVLTLTSQHLAYDAARGYSGARFKMWSPDVCAWNGGKAT